MAEQHPARPAAEAGERPAAEAALMRERIAQLEDRALRTLADLDNLRKRATSQAEQARADERARVAAEWLPVVDSLDRALAHHDGDPSAVVAGVAAVREQALDVLDRLGFPRRDEVGGQFDPAHHEAVATVAYPDVAAGTVVEVVRPGYGDPDRQLRPAAVVVAAGDQ